MAATYRQWCGPTSRTTTTKVVCRIDIRNQSCLLRFPGLYVPLYTFADVQANVGKEMGRMYLLLRDRGRAR
jgi:hypothetical protein